MRRKSDFSEQKKRRVLSTYNSDWDSECGTPRQVVNLAMRFKNASSSLDRNNIKNTLDSSFNVNSQTSIKRGLKAKRVMHGLNKSELPSVNMNIVKNRKWSDVLSSQFIGSPLWKSFKKMPLPLHPNYKIKRGK